MRQARTLRAGALALLAGCAGAMSGCIHNHYYGTGLPGCATEVAPLPIGSVCEVPSRVVGGTVITQGPAVVGATPPRVVISEPARGPRLSWRRADPEAGLATTRVEGGLDETLSR